MTDKFQNEDSSPFHRGELALQDRLGMREKLHKYASRVIRDHMPSKHQEFYAQLPQLVVGSVDNNGRPWASMLVGRPGFISSPNEKTIKISARPLFGDPLNETLQQDASLGFLGIEFHTRRRNRFNGKITNLEETGLQISVDQSFGNCPRYIQTRSFELTPDIDSPESERPLSRNTLIEYTAQKMIENADTFFIATMFSEDRADVRHGVDVSHRGGKPGFVRVIDSNTLIFPDFAGNFHFNTLGNISLNPKAGLLFPDFETGDMLYLTGSAEIIWGGEELEAFKGAQRLVSITVNEVIRVASSLPLRWNFESNARDLTRTGSWQDVAETLENTNS